MTTVTHQTNECTVKAANITGEANEEVVRTLFEILGPIKNLELHKSPYHDGAQEAIVEFEEREAAMTALHLSGTELGDRILVISFNARIPEKPQPTPSQPEQKQHHILYAYCPSSKTTKEDLRTFFRPCGTVEIEWLAYEESSSSESRWAVLDFSSVQAADAAIHMNGQILNDKPMIYPTDDVRILGYVEKSLRKKRRVQKAEKNLIADILVRGAGQEVAAIAAIIIITLGEMTNANIIHENVTEVAPVMIQEIILREDDHDPERGNIATEVEVLETGTGDDKAVVCFGEMSDTVGPHVSWS
ncbi:hypothetical protein EC973_009505 [Apophysomyces ossiformis]|uniref:RRM domain-containing protein n=1 Tax=Apophysomyces ossiformis TaxID=679940 RepID=A0A8H7BP39_9FUNG|nr:hypothetical protein EC973_009505 [Apophysomyces ossiformis]